MPPEVNPPFDDVSHSNQSESSLQKDLKEDSIRFGREKSSILAVEDSLRAEKITFQAISGGVAEGRGILLEH